MNKRGSGKSLTAVYFLGNDGDSNLTERNSRRSVAGVLGVDCISVGSDLNWFVSAGGNSRRIGCGVPLGDQIPVHFSFCYTLYHTCTCTQTKI